MLAACLPVLTCSVDASARRLSQPGSPGDAGTEAWFPGLHPFPRGSTHFTPSSYLCMNKKRTILKRIIIIFIEFRVFVI